MPISLKRVLAIARRDLRKRGMWPSPRTLHATKKRPPTAKASVPANPKKIRTALSPARENHARALEFLEQEKNKIPSVAALVKAMRNKPKAYKNLTPVITGNQRIDHNIIMQLRIIDHNFNRTMKLELEIERLEAIERLMKHDRKTPAGQRGSDVTRKIELLRRRRDVMFEKNGVAIQNARAQLLSHQFPEFKPAPVSGYARLTPRKRAR